MWVLFCFAVVASGALKSAGAREAGPSIPPLIVLHHGVGNFFVLASDIPFKVRQAEPKVSWMEVEAIAGDQSAHRTVTIKSHLGNLSRATYDTQQEMWQWMQQGGYNVGVAGAAAWRTPLMPPHPGNDLDYYQGFRNYYPPADSEEERPAGENVARGAMGWDASSSFSADYGGDKAYDGVISGTSKWTSDGSGAESWLALDLGKDYDVTGFSVRHSGAAGEWRSFNTAAYRLESGTALSGPWTVLAAVDNSAQQNSSTTVLESNVRTRYVRLFITDAGVDNYARIPEFEVYGTPPPDERIPSITGGSIRSPGRQTAAACNTTMPSAGTRTIWSNTS
jgi:hypothetical protein